MRPFSIRWLASPPRRLATMGSLPDPRGEVTAHEPEAGERAGEPEGELRPAGAFQPIERGPEVVVLGVEPLEPLAPACRQVRLRRLRQREEVLGMRPPKLLRLVRVFESLERVLADRLQHPVTLVRAPEQALLDERLEDVEIGIEHFFGRLERERQVVEAPAELGDRLVRLETRTPGEQLDRLQLGERWDGVLDLAPDAKKLAARDQELQIRTGLEQRGELGAGVDHLLEVVE